MLRARARVECMLRARAKVECMLRAGARLLLVRLRLGSAFVLWGYS